MKVQLVMHKNSGDTAYLESLNIAIDKKKVISTAAMDPR